MGRATLGSYVGMATEGADRQGSRGLSWVRLQKGLVKQGYKGASWAGLKGASWVRLHWGDWPRGDYGLARLPGC